MGKTTSMWGKTTGKVGGLVYATSGGEQIVREYNPNVANPSTQAQVDQRARMKLMSQLSASLSPVLAITKDGLVSKRNKFTKINFPASYALNGVAQITYENVQITEGNTSLPAIHLYGDVSGGTMALQMTMSEEPSASINRIVYCVFRKSGEGKLEYVQSVINSVRTDPDSGEHFQSIIRNLPANEYVVFAYGMSDTSERATAQYGNLNVVTASDLARLVATRAISFSDYQFTQTRGATVAADGTAVQPEQAGNVRVFVTALGNGGSVSGGGSFAQGASVTVTATPASGYRFVRWVKNGTSQTVSTSNPYTFNVQEQTDLIAVFELSGGNDSL